MKMRKAGLGIHEHLVEGLHISIMLICDMIVRHVHLYLVIVILSSIVVHKKVVATFRVVVLYK